MGRKVIENPPTSFDWNAVTEPLLPFRNLCCSDLRTAVCLDCGERPERRMKQSIQRAIQPIGDIVDVALKIADEQFELEQQIKEAILANDDTRLKLLAKQLVGLE